jgi:arylsulfatase A
MPMDRREFMKQVGAGSAAALSAPIAGCDSEEQSSRLPNIVFIMADDLGYGHLGCYGQEKIRTPHLDRMAAEGMRFTDCYAGSAVCAPSRSVLLTGKHSGHTSVRGNSGGIPLLDSDVTIGEVLKQAEYTTGIFGKWGVGDHGTAGVPYKQGFDEFFGYLHQVHCHFYYPWYLWDNDQKYLLPGNEGGKKEQYTHDVIVDKALDFIRRRKDAPFFLYVPFTIPHTELLVPEDSMEEYRSRFDEPTPYIDARSHYADQPEPRAAFAGMVTRMDRDVGRIFDVLKETGIDDNTIVIFTSDNGGQSSGGPDPQFFNGNGPLRLGKSTVYEGGIRVPTIARWPGVIPAGVDSDHAWAFWDVMPTLADLAGVSCPDDIDGVSALPAIIGEERAGHSQQQREFMYWEHPSGGKLTQAVRMGDWKAVRLGIDAPLELYNLDNDIGETNNVATQHPEIVQRIEQYLTTARVPAREYDPEPPTWGYPANETGYVR